VCLYSVCLVVVFLLPRVAASLLDLLQASVQVAEPGHRGRPVGVTDGIRHERVEEAFGGNGGNLRGEREVFGHVRSGDAHDVESFPALRQALRERVQHRELQRVEGIPRVVDHTPQLHHQVPEVDLVTARSKRRDILQNEALWFLRQDVVDAVRSNPATLVSRAQPRSLTRERLARDAGSEDVHIRRMVVVNLGYIFIDDIAPRVVLADDLAAVRVDVAAELQVDGLPRHANCPRSHCDRLPSAAMASNAKLPQLPLARFHAGFHHGALGRLGAAKGRPAGRPAG
jgi:hypothetical protein